MNALTLPEIEVKIAQLSNDLQTIDTPFSAVITLEDVPNEVLEAFAAKYREEIKPPTADKPFYKCSHLTRVYEPEFTTTRRAMVIVLEGELMIAETIYKQKAPVGAEA